MRRVAFVFKKSRYEILDRPDKWMSAAKLSRLQQRLRAVAAVRFGREPNYSYFSDTAYFHNKVIVICSDAATGEDYCFCAMCYLGKHHHKEVVHLGSVFSAAENKGFIHYLYLFGLMFVFFKTGMLRKIYVTSLTHTPKIFGVVAETFFNVYPAAQAAAAPSDTHIHLRNMLLDAYIKPEWDLGEALQVGDDFVIPALRKQSDGSIMFPDTVETVPKHRKPVFNARVLGMLDLPRGDEVLQVGEVGLFLGLARKISQLARKQRH